ncbi:MAG: hypothetical protein HUJ67_06355 [Ruminiclostridium sp.]|nr:hypothetical protein [Ruminiclostridium sp.]
MYREEHLSIRMKKRQLSHAYLLVGEKRRELANILAAALVCTGEEPPCGQCSGCRKAAQGIHPDIIRVDTQGEGLKANEVRVLRSDVYILPNEASKKVYILEHGELLNQTGQNILLKLIEEGPSYSCFLFLSPIPELLLTTIRSRCETLRTEEEKNNAATREGEILAGLILSGAGPLETFPLLVSLEKRERKEISLLLEEVHGHLVRELPQRPELMAIIGRLDPIRAACEFNIGTGHLTGWIASAL